MCLSDTFENATKAMLTASLAFGITGLFMTVYGLFLFIRFLREYSKPGTTPDYEKK